MPCHYDIFLSHSSQDKGYVNLLKEGLIRRKYRVWYDKTNIDWGDNLQEKIEEGLRQSYKGIVVLSRHYLELRRWTAYEFNHLIQSGNIFLLLHNITIDQIRTEYPQVYNDIEEILVRFSISDEHGYDYVLDEVKRIVRDTIIDGRQEFATLRDLLGVEHWLDADIETYKLINKKFGLLRFHHEDLKLINRLWTIYSNEHYGFSIQKRIYLECLARQDNNCLNVFKDLNAFRDFVNSEGWIRVKSYKLSSNPNYNISTRRGHFPMMVYSTNNLEKAGYWTSDNPNEYVGCMTMLMQVVIIIMLTPVLLIFLVFIPFIPVMHYYNDLRLARQLHKFFSNRDLI